jgi:hypothetical protein
MIWRALIGMIAALALAGGTASAQDGKFVGKRVPDTQTPIGPLIVTDDPIEVLTTEDFTAPEELRRALAMTRLPEQGRFALTSVSFEPRTGARRALRFDPRAPDGERWSVAEAPRT